MILFLLLLLGAQGDPVPKDLPSAARCTALFGSMLDQLRQKSGDPTMTKAFEEDIVALRNIVVAERRNAPDPQAAAEAVIAAERRTIQGPAEGMDLKPCYRVKALGPLG